MSEQTRPWLPTQPAMVIGGQRYRIDLGDIAMATAMLAFLWWHLYVTLSASTRLHNVMLIVPATCFFAILWMLIVGAAVAREEPNGKAPDLVARAPIGARIIGLMALLGVFIAAIPIAGLDLGGAIFTIACLLLLGERNLISMVLYSIGLGAFLGYVLRHGLSSQIPLIFF